MSFEVWGDLKLRDKTQGTLSGFKTRFGKLIGTVTKAALGIGVALTGIGAVGIRAAADFESATVRIIAATGLAGEEAANFREDIEAVAKAMGVEYGVGATAAMEALESLVKAGLEGEDAINALSSSLQLAKLESIGTAEASNMLVQALTMFNIPAEDAERAINRISAASDLGIGNAADYAEGLSNVGATANAMGFSIEDTLAGLVQLDNTFGSAQASGTFFNRMLLQLSEKADEAGLDIYEADGSMRSLDEIVTQMRMTLKSYGTDQEKANEWLGLFDVRAQRAILALVNYDEDLAETGENLLGMQTAQDKVNLVMDTFNGRMSVMRARLQDVSIEIGEALMPHVMSFLDWLEEVTPSMTGIIDQFAEVAGGVWDFATALAEGDWDTAWEMIKETYSDIAEKMKTWWDSVDWSGLWDKLVEASGEVWDAVKESLGDWVDKFKDDILPQAKAKWGPVFSGLLKYTGDLWDKIKAKVLAGASHWGDKFKEDVLPQTEEEWNQVWGTFFGWAETVWDVVKDIWKTAWGAAWEFLPQSDEEWWNLWTAFKTFMQNLWSTAMDISGDFGTELGEYLKDVDWGEPFKSLFDWFRDEFWPTIGAAISENAPSTGFLGLLWNLLDQSPNNFGWPEFPTDDDNLPYGPEQPPTDEDEEEPEDDEVVDDGVFDEGDEELPPPEEPVEEIIYTTPYDRPDPGYEERDVWWTEDEVTGYAGGADFVTQGPMKMRVGEAGPEHVKVTPLGLMAGGMPTQINIRMPIENIYTEADENRIIRKLKRELVGILGDLGAFIG